MTVPIACRGPSAYSCWCLSTRFSPNLGATIHREFPCVGGGGVQALPGDAVPDGQLRRPVLVAPISRAAEAAAPRGHLHACGGQGSILGLGSFALRVLSPDVVAFFLFFLLCVSFSVVNSLACVSCCRPPWPWPCSDFPSPPHSVALPSPVRGNLRADRLRLCLH